MLRVALNADILTKRSKLLAEIMAPIETWLYPQEAGLYCEPGGFYVDPHRAVDRAIITHGGTVRQT